MTLLRKPTVEDFPIPLPEPPSGSEGPLHLQWDNSLWDTREPGYSGYCYMTTLTITGDLRDFGVSETPELEEWLTRACGELPQGVQIRSAILLIEVEFGSTLAMGWVPATKELWTAAPGFGAARV